MTTDLRATTTSASPAKAGAILAIILVGYFMVLLDNSVIFTGLPSIRAGLGLSAAQLSWIQDSYVLVFGGLLLLAARAGDIVGEHLVRGSLVEVTHDQWSVFVGKPRSTFDVPGSGQRLVTTLRRV